MLGTIQKVIDQSSDGVLIYNCNTKDLICINDTFTNLYGYKQDDVATVNDFVQHVTNNEDAEQMTQQIENKSGWRTTTGIETASENDDTVTTSLTVDIINDSQSNNELLVITLSPAQTNRDDAILRDPLTGLPGRELLKERLDQGLARSRRHDEILGVICLDLDQFYTVNRVLDEEAGDKALCAVADRLRTVLRDDDTVARYGDDQFFIVLPNVVSAEGLTKAAQKIDQTISEMIVIEGHEIAISASMGMALYPRDGDDVSTLLNKSETALRAAKEEGGDMYRHYTTDLDGEKDDDKKHKLRHDLYKGVKNNEFTVYYQPRFSSNDLSVIGAEALVRWEHPDLGILTPGSFIKMAEDTGTIIDIGNQVIQQAVTQVQEWNAKYGKDNPINISINLSARQFKQDNVNRQIQETIDDSNIDPGNVEFEITERTALDLWDDEEKVEVLDQFIDSGFEISIDDFGTGYSSLNLLRKIPVNTLKIDRSFVKDLPDKSEANDTIAVVQTIIALARNLNLNIVAEGIETDEQRKELEGLEVDEFQGYLLGKPMRAELFEALLDDEMHNRSEK